MACTARSWFLLPLLLCAFRMPAHADAPLPVTLPVAADTSVHSFVPAGNFGATRYLLAGTTGEGFQHETLLRFDLTGVAVSTVTRATLQLRAIRHTGQCQLVHLPDAADGWQETVVCWDTRPQDGDALLTFTLPAPGPLALDVTAAVNAELAAGRNRVLSLRLAGVGLGDIAFCAREVLDVDWRPQLTLE